MRFPRFWFRRHARFERLDEWDDADLHAAALVFDGDLPLGGLPLTPFPSPTRS
jgi:hypothetical protein